MTGAGRSAEEMAAEDAARAMEEELAAEAAEEAAENAADEADASDPSGWETAPQDTPNYEAVIGALQDELDQARDQRMRAAAEMENLRRRTAREVADAKKFAVSSFARDLLSVSDNLTRALSVVNEEEKSSAGEVWKNLLDGVEMTERELLTVLEKNGIQRIDPQGERFDPNQHQAMFEVPDPSQTSGMIVQVVAPGFMIGERVLRPAMVGVTTGGPKPEAKPDPQKAETVDLESARTAEIAPEPGEAIDKSV
jgi:molecular chaperone GrpE